MKNLLKLGKVLSKNEQQTIIGSGGRFCGEWCSDGTCSCWLSSPHETCPFAEAC